MFDSKEPLLELYELGMLIGLSDENYIFPGFVFGPYDASWLAWLLFLF